MENIREKILEKKHCITQDFEKGIYKDNVENKRLHRVGKKYGGKKENGKEQIREKISKIEKELEKKYISSLGYDPKIEDMVDELDKLYGELDKEKTLIYEKKLVNNILEYFEKKEIKVKKEKNTYFIKEGEIKDLEKPLYNGWYHLTDKELIEVAHTKTDWIYPPWYNLKKK